MLITDSITTRMPLTLLFLPPFHHSRGRHPTLYLALPTDTQSTSCLKYSTDQTRPHSSSSPGRRPLPGPPPLPPPQPPPLPPPPPQPPPPPPPPHPPPPPCCGGCQGVGVGVGAGARAVDVGGRAVTIIVTTVVTGFGVGMTNTVEVAGFGGT